MKYRSTVDNQWGEYREKGSRTGSRKKGEELWLGKEEESIFRKEGIKRKELENLSANKEEGEGRKRREAGEG